MIIIIIIIIKIIVNHGLGKNSNLLEKSRKANSVNRSRFRQKFQLIGKVTEV